MKTRAAIAFEMGGKFEIEEVEIPDEPGPDELLVEYAYAGLCHSDDHIRSGSLAGDILPMLLGHEGAGTVLAVGNRVRGIEVGDHVAASFVPSCGNCPSCASGAQHLCDNGAAIMTGTPKVKTSRGMVPAMAGTGTFANHAILDEWSVVKVGDWYPLVSAALCSCGVATGWGSAVNVAQVAPGQVVVVVGVGGIGINAVQGAAIAGATTVIAVDPVEMKRDFAMKVGATHTAATMEEALPLLQELSWGRLANAVLLTVADATSDLFEPAMRMVGKGGNLTLVSMAPFSQTSISVNAMSLALSSQQIRGSLFGNWSPRASIPHLLRLSEQGKLELEGLATKRFAIDEIDDGFEAMHHGEVMRAVIDYSL